MNSHEPTEAWLLAANARYRGADIPPKQRPAQAWREYAVEHGLALDMRHPITIRIFAWFRARSTPSSAAVGPFFRGAFFWDAMFWPLDVPVIFGTVRINVLERLPTMPPQLKAELAQDERALEDLVTCCASAIDCALSVEEVRTSSTGFPRELLQSGCRELTASAAILLSSEPTGKATNSLALAAEMFGKWLLATKAGLDEKGAKKYRHELSAILRDCSPYLPQAEHAKVTQLAGVLPPMGDRYKGGEPKPRELWECYLSTTEVVACLLRAETGINTRTSLRRSSGGEVS